MSLVSFTFFVGKKAVLIVNELPREWNVSSIAYNSSALFNVVDEAFRHKWVLIEID